MRIHIERRRPFPVKQIELMKYEAIEALDGVYATMTRRRSASSSGLPLYMNAEVSMPLIPSFLAAGMSPGAALA